MNNVQHDFIIIDPIVSTGILKVDTGDINTGIVKEFGDGYWENGIFVENVPLKEGITIIFTQSFKLNIGGEDIYITRGRDVIKVKDDSET